MSYVALGRFRSRHLIARVTNKCVKNAPSTLRTLLCMHVYTLDLANKRAYTPIPVFDHMYLVTWCMAIRKLHRVDIVNNKLNHFPLKHAYTKCHHIFHYCTKLSLKFEVNEVPMYILLFTI